MSSFSQTKTITVALGATTSDKFAVGDFLRGSLRVTAAVTGDINFEVSNDNGATWETLSAAAAAFTSITTPAVGKPRALPSTLFNFRHARILASTTQLTADGTVELQLFGA